MSKVLKWDIDDTSPMWVMKPWSDYFGPDVTSGAGVSRGWQAWFDGLPPTGFQDYSKSPDGGQSGLGNSFHLTTLPGASASLTFYGTGITVNGFSNTTFQIYMDGQLAITKTLVSQDANVLFEKSGLPSGRHNITIQNTPDSSNKGVQQLALGGASVLYTIPNGLPNVNATVVDNQDKKTLQYSGQWTDTSVANQIHDGKPFVKTNSSDASVSYTFTNAVAIAINGTTDYGGAVYTVTLDDEQFSLNQSVVFITPDTSLFFMAGLDPNKPHTIKMANVAGATMRMNSMTAFTIGSPEVPSNTSSQAQSSPSSTSSTSQPAGETPAQSTTGNTSSGLSAGAIAGIVVAVVFLLAALVGGLLLLRRRRRYISEVVEKVSPYDDGPPSQSAKESEPATMASLSPLRKGQTARTTTILPVVDPANRPATAPSASSSQPHPPSPGTATHASSGTPMYNVDQIVELVAQRIDQPARAQGRPSSAAPPAYRSEHNL